MKIDRRTLVRGFSASVALGFAGRAQAGAGDGTGRSLLDANHAPVEIRILANKPAPARLLDCYGGNRVMGVPNLITEGFLVHMISLTRRRAQQAHETTVLAPALTAWIKALQTSAAAAPGLPELATDLIAVLAALLGERELAASRPRAQAEYDQIMAASAIAGSKLTGVQIDFTQFKPRGAYAGDPAREAYFRTFRYAGTLAFLLVPSPATGVNEDQAAMMAAAAVALSRLTGADPAQAAARPLFAALEATFGPADDYGPFDAPADMEAPAVRKLWVETAAASGRVPQVIDVIYESRRLRGKTPGDVALSWRLLPGRRLGDVVALQKLVFPGTGLWNGAGPAPFDAGFIDGKLVKAYVGLDDAMALTSAFNATPAFSGLEDAQLRASQALLETRDVSSPVMRLMRAGQATGEIDQFRAHALAAAYIHHRHATVLVAKQSYAGADKGIRLAPERKGALLASTPQFVRALGAYADGLAHHFPDPAWDRWSVLLGRLEDIAWMQQRWNTGSAQADRLLNDLDLQVAELVDSTQDQPIIADIHTCPAEGKVVEIGLARPVTVTAGEAQGAFLPACQFKQPLTARLTDAAWAEIAFAKAAQAETADKTPRPAEPLPERLWTPRFMQR